MNSFLLQSESTKAEARELVSVGKNFTSSQDSKPMLAIKQDAMTGAYKLTYGRVPIDPDVFMDCFTHDKYPFERYMQKFEHILNVYHKLGYFENLSSQSIQNLQQALDKLNAKKRKTVNDKKEIDGLFNAIKKEQYTLYEKKKNELMYCGHSLFSFLLPDDFEYTIDNGMSPILVNGKPEPIVITHGVLISGTLNKAAMGSASASLIHHIWKDYGEVVACEFVSMFQICINFWFQHQGFSIGLEDFIPGNKDIIQNEMQRCFLKAHAIMNTETDPEIKEMGIMMELNKAATVGQKHAKAALQPTNNLVSMIRSGSKGDWLNITQVTGLVGQQYVSAQRIHKSFGNRTLPHYPRQGLLSTSPDTIAENATISQITKLFHSRGFVTSSFYYGLQPAEFFFVAAGGREGLIDTGCKSVTGETLILIIEDGDAKVVEIGPWIDSQIDGSTEVERYEHMDQELLNLKSKVYIPTVDSKGNTSWGEMTAITRHLPGDTLYKIETESGRDVIVTASKSLLIWDEATKEFTEKYTIDVKVGDCVPVTHSLNTSSSFIQTSVDMSKYLPKTEYVYGTEFNKAVTSMKKAMEGRRQIPVGWWEENNGKNFITPYDKKARLQRAISGRSDIQDGYIYPYAGARNDVLIPEKFELNEENGYFIGLYLADGNSVIDTGYVQITNNDKQVQEFVVKWFEKMKITPTIKSYKKGNATEIRGFSRILGEFLPKFVGHTSYKKYVPHEAFTAPECFVKGLLGGYFSGDGRVTNTSISVASSSKELLQGVSSLCSQLGIFTKLIERSVSQNYLYVRCQYAEIFKDKIRLMQDYKQQALDNCKPSEEYTKYKSVNNVVLDPIKSIAPVDVSQYPKVYDVTVPSTYNFTLLGGLGVRDTADTGYSQRRLTKMMEDFRAAYTGVVTNSIDNIIQFDYGGDNMDASHLINVSSDSTEKVFSFVDAEHLAERLNKRYELQASN